MILYHPINDTNHCIYRFINILIHIETDILFEKLKVIDFYYLFPILLNDIKPWPSDIKEYKKCLNNKTNTFVQIPNKRKLFFDLNEVQKMAIATLAAKGIIDIEQIKNGIVSLNCSRLPESMKIQLKKDKFSLSSEFKLLTEGLVKTEWKGSKGLKNRTGLLEYRYDE